MKKLSGLLLLLVLLFSVTTALSADCLEHSNLQIMQNLTETTILQNLGGVAVLNDSERIAVTAESIQCPGYFAADLTALYAVCCEYINSGYGKVFQHPAVLGIC